MRNIALKLMYNGTAYHGWQMQRTEASVQETLQRGLSMVCGERVRLTGVGRADFCERNSKGSDWRTCDWCQCVSKGDD